MENEPLADERSSPPDRGRYPEADYARLRGELARAVARVCPPWLDGQADDLVQAALIKVVEVHRRGEGNPQLSPSYLRKAAYSAVVDEIRRLRRRREVALDDGGAETSLTGDDPGPERLARAREVGRAIRDCLQRLIAPRRQAVTLHLQGHRVPDLARQLGWSDKRAENLVYRGLDDLRQCLDGKGIS